MAAQNRGGRPRGAVNPHGLHDLGILDLVEAAAEQRAAARALAHAIRRMARANAYMARAHARITTGWARDHGDDLDPTPLAEIVPFTRDHLRAA